MKQGLYLIILIILGVDLFTQVIPFERRVAWEQSGYQGTKPEPQIVVDVTDFGAIGDSMTDNFEAISNAIQWLEGRYGTVYFPAGDYLVKGTLVLPDCTILAGESAQLAGLVFDLEGETANCITISKSQNESYTTVMDGYFFGSDSIVVEEVFQAGPGDYLEIEQENGEWDTNPASWATYAVGQIVQVEAVNGNIIRLRNKLRFSYNPLLNPRVRLITPLKHSGIECLTISRLDDPGSGNAYNIYMGYAVQCRISGVESNFSAGSHIYLANSSNITISGCYIHHSFGYDGSGTRGYGITLNMHTGQCLIENNILRHLRHALMVKTGANGNVFGYNYSLEPYRTEPIHDFSGDISLHGHFAYANLFEGNVVQNIIVDHYWGPSGPHNTFFRNRAELYGIIFTVSDTTQTNNQNVAGNELTNTGLLYGNYLLPGDDHLEYGNNVKGEIIPPGTGMLQDKSYYLENQPAFWDIDDIWPSLGYPNGLGQQTIPAVYRFKAGPPYAICSDSGLFTGETENRIANFLTVWPNTSQRVVYFEVPGTGQYTTELYSVNGKIVFTGTLSEINDYSTYRCFYLPESLVNGVYLFRIITPKGVFTRKILVKN